MSHIEQSFAARMRALRIERGLSLRTLARIAIYGKSYLHELETGAKQPTEQAAERIDEALDARGELAALVPAGLRRREVIARASLAAAMPGTILAHGRQVGAEVPRQLAERTARLRRLDDYLGGADTYGMYVAELDSAVRLVQDGTHTDETRRALLTVVGELAQLAAWAAFDSGRSGDADRLNRVSLAAARDAGDRSLAGNALACLAYQDTTDLPAAAELASAADDAAGAEATPGVRALFAFRRAWVSAMNGQPGEVERHLDIGSMRLTEVNGRPEPDWVYWVDRAEAEIMTGRCWTVLRRPLRAIPILETVLSEYEDLRAREKALYLSWLADAYLDANEVEQACVTAARAVRLGGGLGSIRPVQRIQSLAARLEPHAALPCVAELREIIAHSAC
ncbi:helix-turn-helix domain-containing protein [Solwaraspora sp. WMMD1047]|uniref:helix-turn-helix domain-containing protein n=1 Tax=Solwaraspora sp. WMMD1047 TaxID=3016102 RepID=UPI0024166180|nr:helix-turn-helix domain-containing protein [Solwaraspora sp. WMMD1047]MDG4828175.1 helix-turn-helix domain-containing protein [Solwaraspora sp. WMMD1047]